MGADNEVVTGVNGEKNVSVVSSKNGNEADIFPLISLSNEGGKIKMKLL